MNQTRRKLVMASSAVPMALILPGCGGGDASTTAANGNERATPMSYKPNTGGYVDIGNVPLYSIDSIFRSGGSNDYLRYFMPMSMPGRTQAVLNASNNRAWLRLLEVITTEASLGSVTHHRCLTLELPDFPAVGAVKQYSEPGSPYKGVLIVNTTNVDGAGASHYEYELKTGGIKVTHSEEGKFTLEFIGVGFLSGDYVDGSPTLAQTFSAPVGTINLASGNNKGVKPFLLSTAANRLLVVTYVTETGGWI